MIGRELPLGPPDRDMPPAGWETEFDIYLLNRFHIAGFPFYHGMGVIRGIREGDLLQLVAEPTSPHDRYAVEVYRGRHKLGYVPRSDNRHISRLLRQGARLRCEVIEADPEDSPWHMLKVVVSLEVKMEKRPGVCPECGGESIARYLWGLPARSEKLQRDIDEGRIVCGGCCVTGADPDWHCNDCGHDWRTSPNEIDF